MTSILLSGDGLQAAPLRVAIVHAHPLERYPPVTNAIDYLCRSSGVEVLVISVETPHNQRAYTNPSCQVERPVFRISNASFLRNVVQGFQWHWTAAKLMASWNPDVIFYWDPQSALACYLCMRWLRCNAALFVHHHEYHAPEDFKRVGMRIARIGHYFERTFLFPKATWISQTNAERMRLFRRDIPELTDEQTRVMPNYPPESWLVRSQSAWMKPHVDVLRLVYVGSLSLNDTFIGPLVDWLLQHPGAGFTLDIFTNNCESRTLQFLRDAHGPVVCLHEGGVEYHRIPEVLADFHVGLVLYRCKTLNYAYNASNKLFEYLICGLDVWYPPTMLGVKPYARDTTWPRVIEVDFEALDSINTESLRSRESLPHVSWTETCGSQLAILEKEMKACLSSSSR